VTAKTVLVVDDERYIVDLLADLLEEEGYTVRRAYDGAAAWREITRETPDLVLTDVMMPGLDGLSLASRLIETYSQVPVILMSAAVTPRNPGITFIAKPFDIDRMLTTISQMLTESHTA